MWKRLVNKHNLGGEAQQQPEESTASSSSTAKTEKQKISRILNIWKRPEKPEKHTLTVPESTTPTLTLSTINNNQDLVPLLKNPRFSLKFESFLREEWSSENLGFWQAVEQLKSFDLNDKENTQEEIKRIYSRRQTQLKKKW